MPNTIATKPTTVAKQVTVTDNVTLYVRESKKNPDVLVVGASFNGTFKRIALVRATEDGATVRTLNGNPRERSSRAETQVLIELPWDELTTDE